MSDNNNNNILERSLDDIIGEQKRERKFTPTRRRGASSSSHRHNSHHPYRRQPPPPHRLNPDVYIPRTASGANARIPVDVLQMAQGRPTLRLKNIHPDLNGQDLNDLFSSINAVDFIKFDDADETVAYICFQNDCERSNSAAIDKYDGKKAMGKILIVENAHVVSLADRITVAQPRDREEFISVARGGQAPAPVRGGLRGKGRARFGGARSGNGRGGRGRGGSRTGPTRKTAEDLDKELNDYMGQSNDATSNGEGENGDHGDHGDNGHMEHTQPAQDEMSLD
ncbi:uncharacterized protein LODBEIA_P07040 [Lodderomyces beijingensis]|uniref:Chromatin target of PRMT1 protein C-terminal domain-containing protein n=1 Tax=Lodderomyces beijingensis TaxID=1775926 RepID=A0ABP0ZJK6_9ASCO